MQQKIARLIQRHNSAAVWESNNPILLQGEIGFDTTSSCFKVGDGQHHWNQLPYTTFGVSYNFYFAGAGVTLDKYTNILSSSLRFEEVILPKTIEDYTIAFGKTAILSSRLSLYFSRLAEKSIVFTSQSQLLVLLTSTFQKIQNYIISFIQNDNLNCSYDLKIYRLITAVLTYQSTILLNIFNRSHIAQIICFPLFVDFRIVLDTKIKEVRLHKIAGLIFNTHIQLQLNINNKLHISNIRFSLFQLNNGYVIKANNILQIYKVSFVSFYSTKIFQFTSNNNLFLHKVMQLELNLQFLVNMRINNILFLHRIKSIILEKRRNIQLQINYILFQHKIQSQRINTRINTELLASANIVLPFIRIQSLIYPNFSTLINTTGIITILPIQKQALNGNFNTNLLTNLNAIFQSLQSILVQNAFNTHLMIVTQLSLLSNKNYSISYSALTTILTTSILNNFIIQSKEISLNLQNNYINVEANLKSYLITEKPFTMNKQSYIQSNTFINFGIKGTSWKYPTIDYYNFLEIHQSWSSLVIPDPDYEGFLQIN